MNKLPHTHNINEKNLAEEIIYFLEEAGLEPVLNNKSVTTNSFYIQFVDPKLRSLRVSDHEGRSKYRYKWNLRLDIKDSYTKLDNGVTRFYYSLKELPNMIQHMHNYLQKCKQRKTRVENRATEWEP